MSADRQRGFTLIELMTASVAGGVVILAASAFLLRALDWYDDLSAKVEINRHAREVFDLLAYGGVSASAGHDATKNLYGIRGHNHAPGNGLRSNYAFQYASNGLTLMPDRFTAMTIHCVSPNNPLPDCGGGNKNVQGWMGDDVNLDAGARSVSNDTVEVIVTLMDPFEVQRAQAPSQFADTYRMIFTLNLMENDP